jgi:SAM-dependent methyltransferase
MLNRSTGRWLAVSMLILLTPIFGTAVAAAVLKIFHKRISSDDLPLGVALVGMSVNYAVTALNWRAQERSTWVRLVQSPLIVVPTAMVAVMLAAWFFDEQQVGLFAAIGLSAAAVFAGLVLPIVSPLLPKTTMSHRPNGKIIAVFAIVLLASSTVGILRLRVESHDLCLLMATGLTTILLVITALLARIELVAAIMVPILFSLLLSLGALGLAGIEITRSNSLFILFLLGLSTDYSVNALWKRLEAFRGRNSGDTGVILLNITIALCVLMPLFFTGSTALRTTGLIGLIVVVSSLTASLLLSPAIANWLLPINSKRPAPSLKLHAANRVKSLYSYLDIDAEQYVGWKLRLDPIFTGIDPAVPKAGQILDAGCGYGQMSNTLALQSTSRTVIGIDRDERKILVAKCAARTLDNVRFLVGDLLDWEYPQVDCVLLIDVLHYWNAEKQQKIIAKAATCLRENGTLIFREGLASSSLGHRLVHLGERWSTWTGQNRPGDGLFFQDREFYLTNFQQHGLSLRKEVAEWGPGSNSVLVFGRDGVA